MEAYIGDIKTTPYCLTPTVRLPVNYHSTVITSPLESEIKLYQKMKKTP